MATRRSSQWGSSTEAPVVGEHSLNAHSEMKTHHRSAFIVFLHLCTFPTQTRLINIVPFPLDVRHQHVRRQHTLIQLVYESLFIKTS